MSDGDTQTLAVSNPHTYDDEPDVPEEKEGWCHLISISQGTESLSPPLLIPETTIVDKNIFKIGRADSNDLVISHLGISGLHFELHKSQNDSGFVIVDRSTNGTWADNERLVRGVPKELHFGARIEFLRVGPVRCAFVVANAGNKGSLLNGRYLLRRDLGSGAYAQVKLAIDPRDGHQYAVKIMERSKMGLNRGAADKLLEEVQILHRLDHYGIVKTHDHFENEQRFYIILDYLPAGDLLEYLLDKKVAFDEECARDLFCQLTEAIHYLHQQNVVHRDIKPENILLDDREKVGAAVRSAAGIVSGSNSNTNSQSQGSQPQRFDFTAATSSSQMLRLHRETTKERYFISRKLLDDYSEQPALGPSGLRVKLTDFGLSKNASSSVRLKTVCGTPQYLAPEVLKHFNPSMSNGQERAYGKEIDIWSLGAILFVLLTVNTPFPESNLMQAALAGTYDRDRLRGLSDNVKDLIQRMLTVDPKRRITTNEIFEHPWCHDHFVERQQSLQANRTAAQTRRDRRARAQQGDKAEGSNSSGSTAKLGGSAPAQQQIQPNANTTSTSINTRPSPATTDVISKSTSPRGATKRKAGDANLDDEEEEDDGNNNNNNNNNDDRARSDIKKPRNNHHRDSTRNKYNDNDDGEINEE